MKRLVVTILAALASVLFAQEIPGNPQDVEAIGKVIAGFVEARNALDAPRMASFFAEDGELTGTDGVTRKGRAAVEAVFVGASPSHRGTLARREIKSIRFLAPDIAVVRTTGDMTGVRSHFMDVNVMIKREGKWLVASFYNVRLPISATVN